MSLAEMLTPKDTEEIKPGLFLQQTKSGYRQISPAAWNGKINWKNFLLGHNWVRSFIWFAILLLLAYGYWQDNGALIEQNQELIDYVNEDCPKGSLPDGTGVQPAITTSFLVGKNIIETSYIGETSFNKN